MKYPTLYCNCFPYHEPRTHQFIQRSLMCGSAGITDPSYKTYLKTCDFRLDDTGDNISHLNKWMGDLTGLYWVWKNTDDEFVGTNQYRRFWNEQEFSNLVYNDKTLYINTWCDFGMSVYDQFVLYHGEIPLKIFRETLANNALGMTPEMFDQMKTTTRMSTCNSFFCHRTLFDRICKITFDIALEVYAGTKYALPYIQHQNQTRMIAFAIERILTLIYHNTDYYLGPGIKIQQVNGYTL